MNSGTESVDAIFRALADPTRRRVLERLTRSPASVTELARPFEMALASFVQHLSLLEQSGLVSSRKVGRVRTYRLAPNQLRTAEEWLAEQRSVWERRLNQLDTYLLELKEEQG